MVGVKGWKLKRQEMINKLATNKNNPWFIQFFILYHKIPASISYEHQYHFINNILYYTLSQAIK